MRNIFLLLFFTLSANAQQSAGRINNSTLFTGTGTAPTNYIKNPSGFFNTNDITVSGAAIARDTTTANKLDGIASLTCDTSGSNGYCQFALNTIQEGDKTGNCEVKFQYKGDATLHVIRLTDLTDIIAQSPRLTNATDWTWASMSYPCGALRAVRFSQDTVAGNPAAVNIGRMYWGPATNLNNVAQAQFIGSAYFATTGSCTWTRTNAALGSSATVAACPGPTVELNPGPGTIQTTDSDLPKITVNSLPPGNYRVVVNLAGYTGTSTAFAVFAVNDGTTTSGKCYGAESTAGSDTFGCTIEANFSYTTTANQTFEVYSAAASGVVNIWNAGSLASTRFSIYRYPSQSEIALTVRSPATPTVQTKTSGTSATYTTPYGTKYIRVRMVGAGGGGAGSGTTAGTAGQAGTASTFTCGSQVLTANGGGGGVRSTNTGGAGGTATLGTGPIGTALTGSSGLAGAYNGAAGGGIPNGSPGASSPFGGAGGGGGAQSVGGDAAANTGSGGGGGGAEATAADYAGAAGGAGGFIDAILVPSATCTYTIGVFGANGIAGSNGHDGGDGAAGYLEVTEYPELGSFPLLVGSVTSNSLGLERIERALISLSGCAITSQSGTWVASTTNNATGDCTLNLTSGIFSATPSCFVTTVHADALTSYVVTGSIYSATSSAVRVNSVYQTAGLTTIVANPGSVNVTCMGPR